MPPALRLPRALLLALPLFVAQSHADTVETVDGLDVMAEALRAEYRVQIGHRSEAVTLSSEEMSAVAAVLGGGQYAVRTLRAGNDGVIAVSRGERGSLLVWEWYRVRLLDGRCTVSLAHLDELVLAAASVPGAVPAECLRIVLQGGGGRWEALQSRRLPGGSTEYEGRLRNPLGALEEIRFEIDLAQDTFQMRERRIESPIDEGKRDHAWAERSEDWLVEGPARWTLPRSLQKLELLARRGSKDSKYRLALELLQLKDLRARTEAVFWLRQAEAEGLSDASVLLTQLRTGLGRMPEDRAFSPHPNCLHPKEENPRGPREVQRHEILTSRETR